MPTFQQLADHCYYLPGSVNVGLVTRQDGKAVLIDTGGDKEAGRAIRKGLEAASLTAVAIINSHSHADHYGGNDYLARNLGLPVWAPEFEEAVLRYPYLEPMVLYGGAAPLVGLRNKWLEAKPSPVDHVYEVVDGPMTVGDIRFERIVTSGHAVRQVALGQRPQIAVFGTDYPTPDGTCLRDYVHTRDLASAHLLAIEATGEGTAEVFNIGTGRGQSVLEIIEACEKVTGRAIARDIVARRPGDPPRLVADPVKLKTQLGWTPLYENIEETIATAWAWHRAHPDGYPD